MEQPGQNHTAALLQKTYLVIFKLTNSTVVSLINFQLLKNEYLHLHYENDALDDIEQVDKPSSHFSCCTRPIF